MRIHLDLCQAETADPRAIAAGLLGAGARRDDELLILHAGQPTKFMGGRLLDLAFAGDGRATVHAYTPSRRDWLRHHRCCPLI